MKRNLTILLILSLFSCQQKDKLESYYLVEYVRYKEFNNDNVIRSVLHIQESDSIIFQYYEYIFKDNSFRIVPRLFIGTTKSKDKNELIKIINKCNIYDNLIKTRDCLKYTYALSCIMNDSLIRETCVDSSQFDENLKLLIKFSKKLSDTLSLHKVDFFEYYDKYKIPLPPSVNEFQKIHP